MPRCGAQIYARRVSGAVSSRSFSSNAPNNTAPLSARAHTHIHQHTLYGVPLLLSFKRTIHLYYLVALRSRRTDNTHTPTIQPPSSPPPPRLRLAEQLCSNMFLLVRCGLPRSIPHRPPILAQQSAMRVGSSRGCSAYGTYSMCVCLCLCRRSEEMKKREGKNAGE